MPVCPFARLPACPSTIDTPSPHTYCSHPSSPPSAHRREREEETAVPHYSVVLVTPTTDAWIPDYLATAGPLVQKHGGRYLARTQSHERLEGSDSPGLIAIVEWPSKADADAFYAEPDYQPHLQARLAGATNTWYSVEGKDDFAPA